MIRESSFVTVLACALCALAACGADPLHPSSPAVQAVRVEHFNPPSGSAFIGPLSVTDGEGCGILSTHGSLENATVRLQEAAARQGADFVKVVKEIKPYSGRDCVHHEYTLEGLGYRVGPPRGVTESHSPPSPTAPASVPPPAATTAECSPSCAPGYQCAAGVCQARCDPGCGVGQICRADRVCVPASAPAR